MLWKRLGMLKDYENCKESRWVGGSEEIIMATL